MGVRGHLRLAEGMYVTETTIEDTMADKLKGATHLDKPAGIRDNPVMEEVWDWLVPKLIDAGLTHQIDSLTVELAIRHYIHAIDASDQLMKSELLQQGRSAGREDVQVRNPLETIYRNESMAFLQYAKQLGLSFGSRVRIKDLEKARTDEEDNPFK